MVNRGMVDSNIKAVQGLVGVADLIQLDVYQAELRGKACSFCSSCLKQCRYGTGGLDAVRIATYAEGYGDPRLAAERAVEVASAVRTCVDCDACSVTCSQGIDIKEAAKKAIGYLA
jgi:Na+-translocating ferredoxin:NAD+ oxidoreductase RnfC subunit